MSEERLPDIEQVVIEEMKFKAKLAIGENAYASLKNVNAVRKYWDLFGAVGGGAAIAKSSVVATAFFAPQGILGLLGFGVAATPVGWVVAAAVLSGGAWYGVMRVLNGATGDRVIVVPKFINTPIDVLATTLFGLMAPLALKVASADGRVSPKERRCIRDYFIKQWGYDAKFVKAALALIEPRLDELEIANVAQELAKYKKSNPDCNYDVMANDLLSFLQEVMESDGKIEEREELVLDEVRSVFADAGRPWTSNIVRKVKRAATGRLNEKLAPPV